jgi:hypothetical protein
MSGWHPNISARETQIWIKSASVGWKRGLLMDLAGSTGKLFASGHLAMRNLPGGFAPSGRSATRLLWHISKVISEKRQFDVGKIRHLARCLIWRAMVMFSQ